MGILALLVFYEVVLWLVARALRPSGAAWAEVLIGTLQEVLWELRFVAAVGPGGRDLFRLSGGRLWGKKFAHYVG